MLTRPLIGVYNGDKSTKVEQHVKCPAVFCSPIRPDLVQDVHTRMRKNKRQAYAVSKYAGHQTSAESWGTGRAVARIPRVPGGGTHRAGQGAFGNMCRGGRMFAPTKTWRRWHRKINVTEKRFALVSAIAASGIPALVMARGHRIEQIPEVPLVVDNKAIDNLDKSSKAKALLQSLGAFADVVKVKESRQIRPGKGKLRNRRYIQRKGPLVIYNQHSPLTKAFRNLPGVEVVNVARLNLLQLAPGGHLGRFVIWTKDAFERLNSIYGSFTTLSKEKKDYKLPRAIMGNADLNRIINSDEIQSALNEKKRAPYHQQKRNPLKNFRALVKLNPLAKSLKVRAQVTRQAQAKSRAALLEQARKGVKPTVDAKTKARNAATKKGIKSRAASRTKFTKNVLFAK